MTPTASRPKKILKSLELLKEKRYFTISVAGPNGPEKHRFDLAKELKISEAGLDEQMADQPQQMFFWSHVKASALTAAKSAEKEYLQQYHNYYLAYRVKLKDKGEYITEPLLRAEVETQPQVIDAKEKWDSLLAQVSLIGAIVDALDHRRSMLVQKANRRT